MVLVCYSYRRFVTAIVVGSYLRRYATFFETYQYQNIFSPSSMRTCILSSIYDCHGAVIVISERYLYISVLGYTSLANLFAPFSPSKLTLRQKVEFYPHRLHDHNVHINYTLSPCKTIHNNTNHYMYDICTVLDD